MNVHIHIFAGADVNATDVCGFTAFHAACHHGHFQCAALLATHGADINANSNKVTNKTIVCIR